MISLSHISFLPPTRSVRGWVVWHRWAPFLSVFAGLAWGCARFTPTPAQVEQALECQWRIADERLSPPPATRVASSPYFRLMGEDCPATEATRVHYVNVLEVGEEALLARIHLIRAAKRSIDLQTFLWDPDDVGMLLFSELQAAAARGVQVRLLIDQTFPFQDPELAAQLAAAHRNLDVKVYNPPESTADSPFWSLTLEMALHFGRMNQRMHNKVMIVDDRAALTGGRNLGGQYYDWSAEFNFRDRDVLVMGPVVKEAVHSFNAYWAFERSVPVRNLRDVQRRLADPNFQWENMGGRKASEELAALAAEASDPRVIESLLVRTAFRVTGPVFFFADPPGKRPRSKAESQRTIPARLGAIVKSTDSEIVIQTPYLLLSRRGMNTLKQLHRDNSRIRIVISTNSLASTNHPEVYALSYRQRKTVLKSLNASLYELKPVPDDMAEMFPRYARLQSEALQQVVAGGGEEPPSLKPAFRAVLHSKTIVIDDEITFIGSHNLDPRSENLNTEAGLVIFDRAVARAAKREILRDAAPRNSWASARKRSIFFLSPDAFLRDLDVWPFRYSSNYELRPGGLAAAPGTDEFYANYMDVGDFPEVSNRLKPVVTVYLSLFGGWVAPLM